MLSYQRAIELFSYDPETGKLTRKITSGNRPAGSLAGSLRNDGYVAVSADRKTYKAHRVAWLLMTGEWPSSDIDHRDTDKSNNRWANLRLADDSTNGANRHVRPNNRLGVKGVSTQRRSTRYLARLCVKGRTKTIGWFDTLEQAKAAYDAAARESFEEYHRP